MRITLTPEELAATTFRIVPCRELSADYLACREAVWTDRLRGAASAGSQLWNGNVYTIENFLQFDETRVLIELSTCEYKDVVLRIELGTEGVAKRFGSNHVLKFVTVNCIPVTTDRKAIFGIRAAGTNVAAGTLGLIGGTLNQDEISVHGLSDIATHMKDEIEEETGLAVVPSELKLFSLNFYRSKYEFLYVYRIGKASTALASFQKEGEFSRLVALDSQELAQSSLKLLDATNFCRNYLAEVLSQ